MVFSEETIAAPDEDKRHSKEFVFGSFDDAVVQADILAAAAAKSRAEEDRRVADEILAKQNRILELMKVKKKPTVPTRTGSLKELKSEYKALRPGSFKAPHLPSLDSPKVPLYKAPALAEAVVTAPVEVDVLSKVTEDVATVVSAQVHIAELSKAAEEATPWIYEGFSVAAKMAVVDSAPQKVLSGSSPALVAKSSEDEVRPSS